MMHRRFSVRRGVAIAAAAFGMSVVSLATIGAGSAGAFTVVNGSGSNTIYQLDLGLSDLFDQAPGCNLAGSPQPLDFSCATPYATGSTVNQPGENGETATLENPYNDVVYQDPALGSGNGVHQLQGQTGGNGQPSAAVSYGRSSASPANSHGTSQQTYVQFAMDGVSWVHFTTGSDGKAKTPTAKIANMTLTQLQQIYNDTLSCTVKGHAYTMDWICLGAKVSTHIDCYMAQNGSGTEGTWAAAVTGGSATPACLNDEATGTAASHNGLFENEIQSITDPSSHYYNNDINNAIYFFSYGKFSVECTGLKASGGQVTGKCPMQPNAAYITGMGSINGIAPSQSSIQGSGGSNPGNFPIIRYLSNVYNNSTASGAASPSPQAALNFMSEYGFLCKPGTKTDIDPYTGLNYRYEIETTLIQNGFFPLDTGYSASSQTAGNAFAEGSLPAGIGAQITDANYRLVDPTYNQSNPQGYCLPIAG